MIKIDVKPLSVNSCWKGVRYKTPAYNKYQRDVLSLLPKIAIPAGYLSIDFEFGLSNKCNDIDNSIKPILDILVKKYGFDDRDVYEINLKKIIVKKGMEYVKFNITQLHQAESGIIR